MTCLRTVLPVLLLSALSAITPVTLARAQVACTPETASVCNDGDACTLDPCIVGQCQNFVIPGCASCLNDAACDDGVPCTADVCDAGQCRNDPASGPPCDDGDACTTGDACQAGVCGGTALSCSDGIACTEDSCDASACVHQPDDSACPGASECAASACRPGDPAATSSGCVADPAPFDAAECTPDDDPCTVDRCRATACAHDSVADVAQCSPVRPSYGHAVALRAGVERLLNFVSNEAPVDGESGAAVVTALTGLRDDLDASIRALGGVETGSALPAGARPRLPANPSIAQLRGSLALVWLRGTPGGAGKFLGAVSRGRRRDEVDPDTARELRRNGRILLADTKALTRDVKNLQRTFSIFQR